MKNTIRITNPALVEELTTKLNCSVSTEVFKILTNNKYSDNTLLAYTKDWGQFLIYCLANQLKALPADSSTIKRYLSTQSQQLKFATLRRYSVAISVVHQILGLKDPISTTEVRLYLMTLRLDKLGDNSQADTFHQQHLNTLHQQLISSTVLIEIRNLAAYHLMFECALKRSELRDMMVSAIDISDHSVCVVTIDNHSYSLSEQGSLAVMKWILSAEINDGYLLRSVNRHMQVSANKLNDSSIYRIMRQASSYFPHENVKFSGQSTRIGAAQHLKTQHYQLGEIQAFGRWSSPVMPIQYCGDSNRAATEQIKFKSFKPWG
jgi:hypothetical protein